VEAGVVAVLRPSKPLEPLARTVAGETMKVHCNHLVICLRLAIGLWMGSCGQMQLHPCHGEELRPKFACEDGVSVADYGTGNPVEPNNDVEERPRHMSLCKGDRAR
jgi:hypothetical protein